MKKTGSLLLILVFVLSSCGKPSPAGGATSKDTGGPDQGTEAISAVDAVIEAEHVIRLSAVLTEGAKAPNVHENRMINPRNDIDYVTVGVEPPYPERLPVAFQVDMRSAYPKRPVVISADVFVGESQVDSFRMVVGGAMGRTRDAPAHVIDIAQHIEDGVDKVIVYARGKLLLQPVGTDPETVDPAEATAPAELTGVIMSNPVRIDFKRNNDNPGSTDEAAS